MSILTTIEEEKELLKMKGNNIMSYTYPVINDVDKNKKALLILLLQDIITTEIFLQKDIEAFK